MELKKNKYLILFLGWVVVITALSLFSFSEITVIPTFPGLDKIVHLIFYFGFTGLAFLFFNRTYPNKWVKPKALTLSCVLAAMYGIFIEVLQEVITEYRAAQWEDVLANITGIFLAGIIIIRFYYDNMPLKWEN